MNLDQSQIRMLVNLQESLEHDEVKFLVFHKDHRYTVTNQLKDALVINSTIFVITFEKVITLGPVLEETKEIIKHQVDIIMSLVQKHPITITTEETVEEKVYPLFTVIEHPTYTADLFTVIGYELNYSPDEINQMLSILQRMQPIYVEYFQKNRKSGPTELLFVADHIMFQLNKSLEEKVMFVGLLEEKMYFPLKQIEQEANKILTSLLIETI